MPKIKVLINGYASEKEGAEFASSSVTLIQDQSLNILVDTGMDRQLLTEALGKEGLSTDDIDFIVLSHAHLDHCLLASLFAKARILDDSSIYTFKGKIARHDFKVPGTQIEIIPTPGHDQNHCSVLVETEEFGKVVVAADLFWWPDNQEQKVDYGSLINLADPYLKDKEALIESREKVLKIADYIIPGHGQGFKVKR